MREIFINYHNNIREKFCNSCTLDLFKFIYIIYLDLFYVIFIKRNPCKKCIISPCCSDKCNEKIFHENHITNYPGMFSLILSCCCLFPIMIFFIILAIYIVAK